MWVAIIIAVAAAMASAYASYSSGQQQKKAANFNSQVAAGNARQAQQAAAAKAEQYRIAGERRMASMRQQYAKAGVEATEGTPLTVLMDSAQELAKDEVRIRYGGEAQSWAFMSESELQKSKGASAYTGGMIGAGASLLGGASRATSMYAGSKE